MLLQGTGSPPPVALLSAFCQFVTERPVSALNAATASSSHPIEGDREVWLGRAGASLQLSILLSMPPVLLAGIQP